MDLNQLLFQHQIALMRSDASSVHAPFGSHFDMVSHYERRIARLRRDMGVHRCPVWLTDSAAAALH